MEIFKIIDTSSAIIWILLPFFRYNKIPFFFFMFLAANDFVGRLLSYSFHLPNDIFWIPITYLMIFSLNEDFFRKYIVPISISFFPFVILGYFASNEERRLFVAIIHSYILIWFVWGLLKGAIINSKIDIFYIAMTLYEFVLVFKLVAMLNHIQFGMGVYYTGTSMQILIGLYLMFFRKEIFIQLKKK